MQYRALGSSGIQASVVGLGTWAIGGWMWGGTDEPAAIRAIQAALDDGINLVDTAPAYGFGLSEQLVGKAIRGRRDRVVLATKCGLVWHVQQGDHYFNSDEKAPNQSATQYRVYKCLRPETIRYEIEQSLKRLGVDCIDLYQTHWQESTTPIADTMATLPDLKRQGQIRALGASNASVEQLDAYRRAGTLDVDQEKYSMLDRAHEADLLPACVRHRLAFLAYSPLASGLLTGRIGPDRIFNAGDLRRGNPRFSRDNLERVSRLLQAFQPIADAHHVSLGQLVIAWTVAQPGCTHALVGARDPAQAHENARAGDIRLEASELATMRQAIDAQGTGIV